MDQFAKLVLYGGRPDLLRPPRWWIDEKVWGVTHHAISVVWQRAVSMGPDSLREGI